MDFKPISSTSQSHLVKQVSTQHSSSVTIQKPVTGDPIRKSGDYGIKSDSIHKTDYIDHDVTLKKLDTAINLIDPTKIVENIQNIPSPTKKQEVMSHWQAQTPEIDTSISLFDQELKSVDPNSSTSLKSVSKTETSQFENKQNALNMKLHFPEYINWSSLVFHNPGVKFGIEHINQTLSKVPVEVDKIFQEHKGVAIIKALSENSWFKQTLAESILISDKNTHPEMKVSSSDYKPDVFGYKGNCHHTSFVMKYFLCTLAEKMGDFEAKEMFMNLKPGKNEHPAIDHTFLKLDDNRWDKVSIDPTLKQFQMNSKENGSDFEDLSLSSKVAVLKCPMIHIGPIEEHKTLIKYIP